MLTKVKLFMQFVNKFIKLFIITQYRHTALKQEPKKTAIYCRNEKPKVELKIQ